MYVAMDVLGSSGGWWMRHVGALKAAGNIALPHALGALWVLRHQRRILNSCLVDCLLLQNFTTGPSARCPMAVGSESCCTVACGDRGKCVCILH